MALVITQKVRESLNGKAFRVYEIAHDGSTLSISANAMDMNYIQAIVGHYVRVSMAAPASALMGCLRVSINASNTGVTWSPVTAKIALTANTINNVCVWEIGPFSPGINVDDFTVTTIDHGVLLIWIN